MTTHAIITDSAQRAVAISGLSRRQGEPRKVIPIVGFEMDFPKKGIGIDFDMDEPRLFVTNRTLLSKVLQLVADVTTVYLDVDSDGTAGYLSRFLLEQQPEKMVKRLRLREVTLRGLADGITAAEDIDGCAFNAYLAGRIIDRLITYRIGKVVGFRIGRAMTPAVAFLLRDQEDLYRATATFEAAQFTSAYTSESEARQLALKLQGVTGARLTVDETTIPPPLPFNFHTLMLEAVRALRVKSIVVLSHLRQLFDGGFVTRPVGAGTGLSPDFQAAVAFRIKTLVGPQYVGSPVWSGPECIRPTDMARDSVQIPKALQPLYRFIWTRTMAACSVPARVRMTRAVLVGAPLEATGMEVLYPGHLRVGLGSSGGSVPPIPAVFDNPAVTVERKPTAVPESLLFDELTRRGVSGNPAVIIKAAENNGYVSFDGLAVSVTPTGRAMLLKVGEVAPEIATMGFLAESEHRLALIAAGRESKADILCDYKVWAGKWA